MFCLHSQKICTVGGVGGCRGGDLVDTLSLQHISTHAAITGA